MRIVNKKMSHNMKYFFLLALITLMSCHETPVKQVTVKEHRFLKSGLYDSEANLVDTVVDYRDLANANDSVLQQVRHAILSKNLLFTHRPDIITDSNFVADMEAVHRRRGRKLPKCYRSERKISVDSMRCWDLSSSSDTIISILISDSPDSLRSWYNALDAADSNSVFVFDSSFKWRRTDWFPMKVSHVLAATMNENNSSFPARDADRRWYFKFPDSVRKFIDSLIHK